MHKFHFANIIFFFANLTGIFTLTDVHIEVPQAVFDRDTVCLVCKYDLEQAALYSIKWYFRDEEFYRFVPKESPPTRIFPLQHFNVDVSFNSPPPKKNKKKTTTANPLYFSASNKVTDFDLEC